MLKNNSKYFYHNLGSFLLLFVLKFNIACWDTHMIDSCSWVVTKVKLDENIGCKINHHFKSFFFVLLTVCQNILEMENEVQCLKRRNSNPKYTVSKHVKSWYTSRMVSDLYSITLASLFWWGFWEACHIRSSTSPKTTCWEKL